MRYLIDTHVLIWYINGDKTIPESYVKLLEHSENKLFISMVSIWELTVKMSLNKLHLTKSLQEIEQYILKKDFEILPISFKHLNSLSTLYYHHRDPFDRLLIAQAISENLTILSADQYFEAYPVALYK